MKVGMIVESGPQGAEVQVLPHLAEQIVPGVEISSVTFRNKPDMIANCGPAVANLLNAGGCDKVLIVWDLYPAWRDDGCRPDCVEDCRAIREALQAAGIADGDDRVTMICIREELEAWLIADNRALEAYLSTDAHPVNGIPRKKRPDRVKNPKKELTNIFQQHGKGRYNDLIHAIGIAKELPDHKRIGRSQSYQRFSQKLQG
jgi:hypothetical protein